MTAVSKIIRFSHEILYTLFRFKNAVLYILFRFSHVVLYILFRYSHAVSYYEPHTDLRVQFPPQTIILICKICGHHSSEYEYFLCLRMGCHHVFW